MAWLGSGWLYRHPITIANHSGVAAPEVVLVIPPAMGRFWENVLSSFNDVRITAADGVTLLDFKFDGTPSIANRTATIQIDDTDHNVSNLYGNAAASASVGAFIYWGNDTANLPSGVDANTSITTNSAKTGLINLDRRRGPDTTFNLVCSAPTADQLFPDHRIRKPSADVTTIYWDLSDCVKELGRDNQNSSRKEEIAYIKAQIFDQDGNDTTAAMTTLNSIEILPDYVVAMPIKAGDHEKRYIIIMTFGLVDDSNQVRVLDQRATLLVNNLGLHPS
tara:strand:+ start:102 stop:932 length:831 start_codon:yes stop_codon:yes gene_type:complete